MKKKYRIVSLLFALAFVFGMVTGCGEASSQPADQTETAGSQQIAAEITEVDYAASVTLDMSGETLKQEVSVKAFVDGDTTHFCVPEDIVETGVLKARYLAVDTPESTGKIEEYGKKASNFTKEKLSNAVSIIIESDDDKWNLDSTGGRYLVWVWYKTDEADTYRNLNIELLQNGLAYASSSANNRYGDTCMSAIAQAKALKLNLNSGEKDPDFYYGDAYELDLKELRTNIEHYEGMKVAFEGVVTKHSGNMVYMEAYDSETDMYYGISIFCGYSLSGDALSILEVGNLARIVGTVQYYQTGDTYQIVDVKYRQMKPDDPNNMQKISDGHEGAFRETSADTFTNKVMSLEVAGETKEFSYAYLAMNTTISMKNLKVESVYTTTDEESASVGAMTLHCVSDDGMTVFVRTAVLHDENNELITAEYYEGKTIDVRGVVDYFDGSYQIKVFSKDDITILN